MYRYIHLLGSWSNDDSDEHCPSGHLVLLIHGLNQSFLLFCFHSSLHKCGGDLTLTVDKGKDCLDLKTALEMRSKDGLPVPYNGSWYPTKQNMHDGVRSNWSYSNYCYSQTAKLIFVAFNLFNRTEGLLHLFNKYTCRHNFVIRPDPKYFAFSSEFDE